MNILISEILLKQVELHGEACYPEEGTGFLLGRDGEPRQVVAVIPLPNTREQASRHNRYLIAPDDYLKAELEAERLGVEILGVFHSHPNHPNAPSEFDREWAQPWFSYIITSVQEGKAIGSRCWRLLDDRSRFVKERIQIINSYDRDNRHTCPGGRCQGDAENAKNPSVSTIGTLAVLATWR